MTNTAPNLISEQKRLRATRKLAVHKFDFTVIGCNAAQDGDVVPEIKTAAKEPKY